MLDRERRDLTSGTSSPRSPGVAASSAAIARWPGPGTTSLAAGWSRYASITAHPSETDTACRPKIRWLVTRRTNA